MIVGENDGTGQGDDYETPEFPDYSDDSNDQLGNFTWRISFLINFKLYLLCLLEIHIQSYIFQMQNIRRLILMLAVVIQKETFIDVAYVQKFLKILLVGHYVVMIPFAKDTQSFKNNLVN